MGARAKAYTLLLIATVIWGGASPIIKFTLSEIDPFPFLSYRFILSGALALFIILSKGLKLPKSFRLKFMLLVYGLAATTFALGFLFLGLDNATVLDLTLIGALGPLAIATGGVIFLKEKISKQETIGITTAVLGIFIATIYPVITGSNGLSLSGNIFLILYLIFDVSSVLIARELVKEKVAPAVISSYAFLVAALTFIPFTLLSYSLNDFVAAISSLPLPHHLGVWYMAFMSGTVAYWLLIKAEKYIEAGEAGLFFYLSPVFSAPLAVFWLHEQITTRFIVGASIIAIGVAIAEHRRTKRRKRG